MNSTMGCDMRPFWPRLRLFKALRTRNRTTGRVKAPAGRTQAFMSLTTASSRDDGERHEKTRNAAYANRAASS